MSYTPDFVSLVMNSNQNDLHHFIGLGNPSSDVLFIGKEAAIGVSQSHDAEREIRDNVSQWRNNIANPSLGFNDIISYPCNKVREWPGPDWDYNPLYPYKGVPCTYNGLGPTWYSYLEIIRGIYNDNSLSLFENAFLTELSVFHAHRSADVNDDERKNSISIRKSSVLCHPFFRKFKVTILTSGSDLRYKIEIESVFDVLFVCHKMVGNQWYDVYRSTDRNRLLIHTRQMSNGFSNHLRSEIINAIIATQVIKKYFLTI